MNDDTIPDYLKELPPFKYLPDPHGWYRSQAVTGLPSVGDFIVCSIDPVASVAHLDQDARQAASKLPSRRYIAFIMASTGLSFGHERINAFSLTFVRQGLPRAIHPEQPIFLDHCIPILPNTSHPTGRKPLCPAHPLPWRDCYIDASPDFNLIRARVTATPRDYTVLLPCDEDNMDYIIDIMCADRWEYSRREGDMRRGDLEAIAALALPPSPTSAFKVPLPPSPIPVAVDLPSDRPEADPEVCVVDTGSPNIAEDDISVIASDDGVSLNDADLPAHPDDLDMDLMYQMEELFDTSGDVNDPVVNVWYDLDLVQEIPDPLLFLEERAKIREIIAEAETRLGIRQVREEVAAKLAGFNTSRYEVASVEENGANNSPAVALSEPESKSSNKSSLLARWAKRSRGLFREGSDYLRPLVCYSSKAHGLLD